MVFLGKKLVEQKLMNNKMRLKTSIYNILKYEKSKHWIFNRMVKLLFNLLIFTNNFVSESLRNLHNIKFFFHKQVNMKPKRKISLWKECLLLINELYHPVKKCLRSIIFILADPKHKLCFE